MLLVVDGYRLLHAFATVSSGWGGGAAPPSPLFVVPIVTAQPSTATITNFNCDTVITFAL